MTTPNPKRPRGQTKPPLRTIEDIERRQREVHAAELDAVRTLVNVLRELAIALPTESKFPYDLADTAKALDSEVARFERASGSSPHVMAGNRLYSLYRGIAEEMGRWHSEAEDES